MTRTIKSGKLIVYLSLMIALFSQYSCVKDFRDGETDFSGTQPVALIAEGGLNANAFSAASLSYPGTDLADTAIFHVNYGADNVAPTTEEFTLGVDPNGVKNYNATGGLQYELMPDSDYSLPATKVTVAKGNNYATVSVIFHPNKIDASKNYMLPISITAAPSGTVISNNQGTIYYHAIGNPLAGRYSDVGYFYHPSAPRALGPDFKTMNAVSSTILQVDLGDLGGAGYIAWLEVDPTTNAVTILTPPGVYATDDFLLQWSTLAAAGYSPAWSESSKCNNTYDPATKTFYLRYGYLGSGGYRVSEEILVKQ